MCDNEVTLRIQALLALRNESNQRDAELLDHLKALRNLCARGTQIQKVVATHNDLQMFIQPLLFDGREKNLRLGTMAWQLLANTIVQNLDTQKVVWERHGEAILQHCTSTENPLSCNTNIQLMIMHNVFHTGNGLLSEQQALRTVTCVWQAILGQKCNTDFDFLHFLFEHFLVQGGRTTVRCYAHMESIKRIAFLDYLATYLRHDSPNGTVDTFLLQYISREFKLKSDSILRHNSTEQQLNHLQPREAFALLRVIACASGCETYAAIYATDHSLFLNVSSMLRCLEAAGKESTGNIFTPMSKLEEVALTSNISRDFESEVSFELKTLLVRCIANLLYKNKTNHNYCLDTNLMPTLFECTNMDARNPLMKEWSILAIRNACIDCPEIQQVVAGLTKQGIAQNDLLNELNLEMGSLRIQPGMG